MTVATLNMGLVQNADVEKFRGLVRPALLVETGLHAEPRPLRSELVEVLQDDGERVRLLWTGGALDAQAGSPES